MAFQDNAVWTVLTQLNPDGTFSGVNSTGVAHPGRIRQEDLYIGVGTCLPEDPVLQALQQYKLRPEIYSVAIPGFGAFSANAQAPAPQAQAQAGGHQVRFGQQPDVVNNPGGLAGGPARGPQVPVQPGGPAPQPFLNNHNHAVIDAGLARPPQVPIPPGNGETRFEDPTKTPFAQTPAMRILQGGLDNPFHPASAIRFENPKLAAWHSKASYLLDMYQESDPQVSHLLSAVYLYATRLNYVSPDLEWLANAFVAEMKMKI